MSPIFLFYLRVYVSKLFSLVVSSRCKQDGAAESCPAPVTPLSLIFIFDGFILVVKPMTWVLRRPRAHILGSINPFDKYDLMKPKALLIASK